jgi:hypothetical protein
MANENLKTLIEQSKDIYIFPNPSSTESISCALSLFYTLKELNKNANLAIEEIPEKLNFLVPSLDYIALPKNFVIAIPSQKASVSQIRYEKDENNLKVFLTIEKGNIKRNDVSFYFAEQKPDLLITLGHQSLSLPEQMANMLSGAPILNIDNNKENSNFGQNNLIEPGKSLSEIIFEFLKLISENSIKDKIADGILAGLILSSDNFQRQDTSADALGIASFLIKKGSNRQKIMESFNKKAA